MAIPFPQGMFGVWGFGAEILFTILCVAACVAIYVRTKEIFGLTKHEGIGYFRDAFLFFGIAYALRFLFSLVVLSDALFDFLLPHDLVGPLFILPLGYFSTMAIFFLLFSMLYKRFDGPMLRFFGHGVAIAFTIISFLTHSHFILVGLQTLLLLCALALLLFEKREKRERGKAVSNARLLSFFTFLLWLLSLVVIGPPSRYAVLPPWAMFVIEPVILFVFIVIYRKVSKWAA